MEFRPRHHVEVKFDLANPRSSYHSHHSVRAMYIVIDATEPDNNGKQTVTASGKGVGSIRFEWDARHTWNYVRIRDKHYAIRHNGWGD